MYVNFKLWVNKCIYRMRHTFELCPVVLVSALQEAPGQCAARPAFTESGLQHIHCSEILVELQLTMSRAAERSCCCLDGARVVRAVGCPWTRVQLLCLPCTCS